MKLYQHSEQVQHQHFYCREEKTMYVFKVWILIQLVVDDWKYSRNYGAKSERLLIVRIEFSSNEFEVVNKRSKIAVERITEVGPS